MKAQFELVSSTDVLAEQDKILKDRIVSFNQPHLGAGLPCSWRRAQHDSRAHQNVLH